MKLARSLAGVLAAALVPAAAQAQERLDPLLRSLASQPAAAAAPAPEVDGAVPAALPGALLAVRPGPGGTEVRAIIHGRPSDAELARHGIIVTSRGDDVISAWIPVDVLPRLGTNPGFDYIQASVPVAAAEGTGPALVLDLSVPETHATALRKLTAITGQGVVVGVIDSGIDWGHPDFVNADGTSRIRFLWDMSDNQGPPPAGYEASGGSFYTQAQINSALASGFGVRETDDNGHGTHVAGTAAGNGRGSGGLYTGVAPDADLIIVKGTRAGSSGFQTADQVDALNFIADYADQIGLPWVTNMSLGGGLDPHDGTSAVEREVDRLVGTGRPGRAVVIAAGNDAQRNSHTEFVLGMHATRRFQVSNYNTIPGTGNEVIFIEGWYPGAPIVSVSLTSPTGVTFGPVLTGNYILPANPGFGVCSADGAVYIENGAEGVNPLNGDTEIVIQIWDGGCGFGGSPVQVRPGTWQINVTGAGGTLHFWLSGIPMGVQFVAGDAVVSGTVTSPGVANNAITVGAYTTRTSYQSIAGPRNNGGTLHALAGFSGRGPTRDGRLKPEIAAPGQGIIAALSAHSGYPNQLRIPGNAFAALDGTSMATPHVAGSVALLLAANAGQDAAQLRDRLVASARADTHTGNVPSNDWGFGKMSVLEAVRLGILVADANLDGFVDVADAVSVVNKILGRYDFTIPQLLAAETVIDGEINAADLVGVVHAIFGVTAAPPAVAAARKAPARVAIGTTDRAAGTSVSIPIEIDAPVALAAIQLEIDLAGTGLEIGEPFLSGGPALALDHARTGDMLTIVAYAEAGSVDGPGGRMILHLPVRSGSLGAGGPVRIARAILVDGNARILDDAVDRTVVATDRVTVTANRPNPFRSGTGTRFLVEVPGQEPAFGAVPLPAGGAATSVAAGGGAQLRIRVYNVRGQLVRSIFDGALPPGRYVVDWDGTGESGAQLAPGLYFGEVASGGVRETLRMIMVGG